MLQPREGKGTEAASRLDAAPRSSGLTIRLHLVLLTGVVILLAVSIFTAVNYRRHRQSLLAGIDDKLVACTRLARAVPSPGYFDRILQGDNPVSEDEYLDIVDRHNQLCLDLDLQYLWSCMVIGDDIVFTTATSPGKDIRDNDHAAFLDVHRDPKAFDKVFRTMEPDFSSFRNEWGAGRMVLVPYSDGHGRPYCVGASVSINEVQDLLVRTMWRSIVIGLGVLVVSLLIALLISTSLSRPIIRLTEMADGIAHGDMEQEIPVEGSVEIRLLARSLATMRDAIRKTMGELVQHRDHLEDIVHERTAELERSNRELEQFACAASHDLREPLRKVRNFAELFSKEYGDKVDEEGKKYIDVMVDGAQRMRTLIEDLLTYSRLGRMPGEVTPVDLGDVVRDVLRDVDATIEEAGATVTMDELPTVRTDGRLIGMVFQNLILNAVKFRGEDSPLVHVSAEKGETGWTISVKDNGIGIDPEHFHKVFEVFHRLHGRGKYRGTGIGLAICQKIVESHGGRIWLESSPGEGSTFFFTLRDAGEAGHSKGGSA